MIRQMLVCSISLMILACGGGGSASAQASNSRTVTFKETDFAIQPATVTLKPGTYTIVVRNNGQLPHDLVLATADGTEVAHSKVMIKNGASSFDVTVEPGTYVLWCAVGDHRARGMEGTITVQ